MKKSTAAPLASLLALAAAANAHAVTLGSCGWIGRADPVLFNAASPDEDAVYYVSLLPVPPPGLSYRIRGEFPHARYISYVTYDGVPIDSVADFEMTPDQGGTNPFLPGADRDATARSYTIHVTFSKAEDAPNVIDAGPGQTGNQFPAPYLVYRIYVPDDATDIRGGVDLPRIEIVADGVPEDVDGSAIPCEGVRDATPNLTPVAEAIARSSFPVALLPLFPVSGSSPPSWSTSTGTNPYAPLQPLGIGQGTTGGIGSNPHNIYIGTTISRALGEVVVIHGKAPTAPATRDGQPIMETGDLRYWSFCTNSTRTTRFVDCISDSDIQVDPDGTYTIAISTPERRPQNAVNWIAFGPEPEAKVLYRHMLPSADFYQYSAQRAEAEKGNLSIEQVMREYFPTAVYCTTAEFDDDRCGF